ncbi:sulfite exporter TauE/SafE family protein [uncultured Brevibacterium sp.]|uniref:sulfite exporter TauE/SafE family protein n=1 Tax=uncultured Brevibacterium sp. TaxID=189678 RepID=UPI0025F9B440|nr:sulfite exporter TauE/SafE family protein [uncultured Brevibacterium sp.]
MTLAIFVICSTAFVGALLQRMAGMGFALVSGPFIVLVLAPIPGVVLVNILGALSSVIVFARTWRNVHWKQSGVLLAGALAGTFPGALLANSMPSSWLHVFIGVLIVGSLATSLYLSRIFDPIKFCSRNAFLFGAGAGVMNASAGMGGPFLSSYAVLTRWQQIAFAASIQPVFITIGMASVASKMVLEESAWPQLAPEVWLAVVAALLVGQVVGDFGSRKVPVQFSRVVMLSLAMLGGVLTIIKGCAELTS